MSERDVALGIVRVMPDEKIKAFLEIFADENLRARIETELMAQDPDAPRFESVEDLFEELDS